MRKLQNQQYDSKKKENTEFKKPLLITENTLETYSMSNNMTTYKNIRHKWHNKSMRKKSEECTRNKT